MKKVGILTLSPKNGGGILTSLTALHDFLISQNYDTTLLYPDFNPDNCKSLWRRQVQPRIKNTFNTLGNGQRVKSLAIGTSWTFWEPNHYSNSIGLWEKALGGFDIFFVSSGTPMAAHPLVLTNKKFILWTATNLENDRKVRLNHESYFQKFMYWLTKSKLKNIESEIISKATVVLPMSHYAKSLYQRDDATVCPYPIKVPTSVDKKYDGNLILAVGRFTDPRKNFLMLIKTWKAFLKKLSLQELQKIDPFLVIVSDATEKMKSELRKIERATLAINIDNQEKNKLYEKASALLITSHEEGLGIVGLEALAYKTPVISTKCGGTLDYVIPGATGEIVKINDYNSMANKLKFLLLNQSKIIEMGKNGQELIQHFFSIYHVHKIWNFSILKIICLFKKIREARNKATVHQARS